MTVKASIVGASGYTGGELLRILIDHPEADILGTYGKTSIGEEISDLHPQLSGLADFTIQSPDYPEIARNSDVVFTATPHGTPMNFVPSLLENGAKVVDLSADYRLDDVKVYEEYYQEHASPELEAIYGLPELYREDIEDANLVANPGCYPTAAILSLAPLLADSSIELDPIFIDSKSGTSGAGASPSQKLHHPTCAENLRAYGVTGHRHSPEIKQEASKLAGNEAETYFTPHLIPVTRGILSTSHAILKNEKDEGELISQFRDFYEEEPFVRIKEDLPQTNAVKGSNYCDVSVRASERGRVVAISAIDNLVKGASGLAIQNMNIMFGLDEETGLKDIALRP